MGQEMSTSHSESQPGIQMTTHPDIELPELLATSNAVGVTSQGYIFDIVLECPGSPEDRNHPDLQALQMVIIGSNNAEDSGGSLDRISQTTWEYRGVIELYPNMGELTFVVQSEDGDDLGYLALTKEEVEKYVWAASSTGMQDVEKKFVMEVGSHPLRLKFAISGMRQDQKSVTLRSLADSGPRFEETDAMLRRCQEVGIFAEACNSMRLPQEDVLDMWGGKLMGRFKETGNLDDLSKAIENYQRAVALTPEYHVYMHSRLFNLSESYLRRYERRGNLDDISKAIKYQERIIVLTPEGHANMPLLLNNLGNSFSRRFERTCNLDDNSKAMDYQQRAIALIPEVHPEMHLLLSNLGTSFARRFEHMGNLDDNSKAIEYQQRAIVLTPEGHPNLPTWLSHLGNSFNRRFEQTGNLDNISKAIEYQQGAVALTHEDHPDMPIWLNNLGISFCSRFERTGELDDISKAIEYQQPAVLLTREGHPDMPKWLNNLGSSLNKRFERTGNLEDLSKAVEYLQRAVALTPKGHASLSSSLTNLCASLTRRPEGADYFDQISTAIEYQQRAVALTPEGHASMPSKLNTLGTLFHRRFERMGDLNDISKAIEYEQHAIALTPEGHVNMPLWLHSLGASLNKRFERTSNLHDISKAIEYHQRTIALTPEGHANIPVWLHNLGISFRSRFEQSGDPEDISKAIEYHRHTVALTPEDHPRMPSVLNSLGSTFFACYRRTGDSDDIFKAIEYGQRAAALSADDHPDKHTWLNNLGTSLHSRFEQTGNLDDLSKAIEYQQHAVALIPEDHPNMPTSLHNLGNSLINRFEQTDALADCKAAVLNFHLAATQLSGPPSDRLNAAREWARFSSRLGDLDQSLQAYAIAVELLSLVVSLGQTIQNRHNNLVKLSDFTPGAVVIAILTEHTSTALEWIEQGRCLVWAQLNQLRTPVDKLRASDAPLAEHFLTLSKALESAGSRSELPAAETTITYQMKIEDQARTHLKLAQEWNNTLAQIRRIPDFHDFLQPRKAGVILSQLPPGGPIIIINVHTTRCDALALLHGADDVLHVPLDDITYEEVEELRQDLCNYLALNSLIIRDERAMSTSGNARNSKPLRRILSVLWEQVVKPILDALGYCSMSPQRNRIWWCPTGPLAFLPIHAAGTYGREATTPGMCLSDYAVSSYIPTVNTLLEKLRHSAQASKSETKILLVSQPNTPGLPSIPGTTTETQTILSKMDVNGVKALRLEGEQATTRRVEQNLQSHQWAHFACHAAQNPISPLKSAFHLHDGQLDLMDLMRQKLPVAEFAFLSACQTSVGDEKLSEEAVHLAAGMLAAGYQGVVGTMWSIGDAHAPQIAEEFYEHLLKERRESGSCGLNSSGAAYALDHAIQKIRNDLPDHDHNFLTWVPYAHYGL